MVKDSICNSPSPLQGGYQRGFNNAQAEKIVSPNPSLFNLISDLRDQVETLRNSAESFVKAVQSVSAPSQPDNQTKDCPSPPSGIAVYDEVEMIRQNTVYIRRELEKAQSRLCL